MNDIVDELIPLAVKMGSIRPDPRNARAHNERNIGAIKKSLETYGQRKPIVVNHDGIIEAGNGFYQAAKELGWTEIAAVKVRDDTDYAKAYALMDNKSAELAEWALPSLKDILESLDTGAFDMEATGFDDKEIQDLMSQFHVDQEGLTDDDAIPEEVETVCKTGDLWQLGNHRLLCGDATKKEDVERLMDGQKADMVFTDPPYGIDYQDVKHNHKKIINDKGVLITALLSLLPSVSSYICCNWRSLPEFLSALPETKAAIIWDKGHGVQNLDKFYKEYEVVLYNGTFGGEKTVDGDVWHIERQVRKDHPTSKPIELIIRALNYSSNIGNIVIDLFLGSGSTLIACEKLDRKCYGMEIDPHWEDFTGNKVEKI